VQGFVNQHRPLILKHARSFVRAHGEKIAPEDVARELELVLLQLGQAKAIGHDAISAPDRYLRAIVLHAARRAKRRHTLIEQIAAGDDLGAVTDDLRALDADLPDPPAPPSPEAIGARSLLDELVHKLSPRDALVFALLIEDDGQPDEVSLALSTPPDEIGASLANILKAAQELRIEGDADRRASSTPEMRREQKLRELARTAGGPLKTSGHLAEPLLALVRAGDHSDDLADALGHLAACPDCRACLTEGQVQRKAVVVLAIEAPRASAGDLSRAASDAQARLFERGDGRWMAIVPADKSESLVKQLDRPDSSVVSRIGVAEPVEVPGAPSTRRSAASILDPVEAGTDAAEVQAWAHVAVAPRRKVAAANAGWTAFALAAVAAAIGIAYILATR
jgi:hypothetical protein